ncbi:MAG: M48 family metalloprotease, partial [Leptospiraceae bacterium]|nr:M48 family metalloprotease [Leptospiraceae bacterium]
EIDSTSHKEIFAIIQEVCELFGIKPKVRVFKIKHNGTENAFVSSFEDHVIIGFCDNILNLVINRNELTYIIGHEFGHYVYDHFKPCISKLLIDMFFNPNSQNPKVQELLSTPEGKVCLVLAFLIHQIQELNADRAGLYAAKDFDSSVIAFLKISAGNVDKFGTYNPSSYLKQAEQLNFYGTVL